MLGCTRQNVHLMVTRHQDLQELCAELTETKLDTLEDTLYATATEKGNVTAAICLLNAHGKSRGYSYGRNNNLTVTGTLDHRHEHVFRGQKVREMDDTELQGLIAERRAALERSDPDGGNRQSLIEDARKRRAAPVEILPPEPRKR